MSKSTHYEDVYTFNKAFGVKIEPEFDTDLIVELEDLSKLRYDLIDEEVNELTDAISQNDKKETIDALSDILYVAYGAGVSFGINLDIELTKFLVNYIPDDIRLNSDISFFEKCRKIYTCLLTRFPKEIEYRSFILNNIYIYTDKLKNNFINKNELDKLIKNLCELIINVYVLGLVYNINLDTSFTIVHESNMSKLCNTEELAKETVENYKKNDNRYDSPNYRKSDLGDYYVVYNESTGKILKSIKYIPACFDDML